MTNLVEHSFSWSLILDFSSSPRSPFSPQSPPRPAGRSLFLSCTKQCLHVWASAGEQNCNRKMCFSILHSCECDAWRSCFHFTPFQFFPLFFITTFVLWLMCTGANLISYAGMELTKKKNMHEKYSNVSIGFSMVQHQHRPCRPTEKINDASSSAHPSRRFFHSPPRVSPARFPQLTPVDALVVQRLFCGPHWFIAI